MDDEKIIPYEPSATLTVNQAVMYMLGYRGEYSFMADTEVIDVGLSDYLYNLQATADCACGNAIYELEMLKKDSDTSPEAIKIAEEKVESTKAELDQANKLPDIAEKYRILLNHELTKVQSGKRSPLVIDQDESTRTGQLRIFTASFQEWLEGMELDDVMDVAAPVALPVDEDAFDKPLGRTAAVSLQVTLGLLVSLFAESRGGKFGSGKKPNVSNIASELDRYATRLNGGRQLSKQRTDTIKGRIELALSALNTHI